MSADTFHKIIGFGFGKTIYLEYGLIMPGLTINDIPIFHNGFAYLLIKTGLIGLTLVLLFSCMLLYKGYVYSKGNPDLKFVFFLLFSALLSFNFSMLVVNGFFSGESCYLIVLAGYTYSMLKNEYKKTQNETV
jgi:O-antigen ligase